MIEFAQVRPVPIDRIASRVDGEVRDTLRKAAVREHDKSPAWREIGEIRLWVRLIAIPNFAISRGCNFGYKGNCCREGYASSGVLSDV